MHLKAGQTLTITPRDVAGTPALIGTTFPTLAENLEPGARILLSDGLIELRVTALQRLDVECEVINGEYARASTRGSIFPASRCGSPP